MIKYVSPGPKGFLGCIVQIILSTSMKSGTDAGQNILNSFLRMPKPVPIWANIFAKSNYIDVKNMHLHRDLNPGP